MPYRNTGVVAATPATMMKSPATVPAGTVPGDFIMVAGVAATTPVFLYGIPYFHNTATTGTFLGINRTQNYVVANGVAAGGAPLSLPMLRAALKRQRANMK